MFVLQINQIRYTQIFYTRKNINRILWLKNLEYENIIIIIIMINIRPQIRRWGDDQLIICVEIGQIRDEIDFL